MSDVNSSAMHSIAEAAGSSPSTKPQFQSALKVFEAVSSGEQVQAPAVPTQRGHGTAPMVADGLKVPPPDTNKGVMTKAPVIHLEDKDAPNPIAVTHEGEPTVTSGASSSAAASAAAELVKAATPAVTQQVSVEAAPADVKPATPGEAAGWAAIKRAEAKLVAERQKFRAEQEQIAAQTKQLQEMQQKLQQTQEMTLEEVRKDPFSVLAKAGWNHKSLLEYAEKAAAGEVPATPAGTIVPQAQQQQNQNLTQEQVAHMVAMHTADIQYKSDLRSELGKDEFKLLRANPAAERAMYDFAVKYAADKQVVLTPVEVARILQDEYRTLLRETLGHEVIRQELGYSAAPQQTQATQQVQQTPVAKQTVQTITNDAGSAPMAPPSWKDLPEHARIAALAKQLPKDLWSNS